MSASSDQTRTADAADPSCDDQPIDLTSKPGKAAVEETSVKLAGAATTVLSNEVSSSSSASTASSNSANPALPDLASKSANSVGDKTESSTDLAAAGGAAWVCKLCNVTCSSLHNYMMHLVGRQHKKVAAFCGVILGEKVELPGSDSSAAASDAAVLSSFQKAVPTAEENPPTSSSSTSAGPNSLHCDICKIDVTGAKSLKDHVEGRKHRNAVAALQKQQLEQEKKEVSVSDLRCQECNLEFKGPIPLNDHLQGKKHAAKLRELEAYRALQAKGCLPDSSEPAGSSSSSSKKRAPDDCGEPSTAPTDAKVPKND